MTMIKRVKVFAVMAVFSVSCFSHAHMMVAQRGTLNVVNDNIYLVLSLPMSAFGKVDANRDGQVSVVEFNSHRKTITDKIQQKLHLYSQDSTFSLEGLLLSPELSYGTHDESHSNKNISTEGIRLKDMVVDQITITGRYKVAVPLSHVQLKIDLFGNSKKQKSFEITVKNKAKNKINTFKLTPSNNRSVLFN